MSRHEISARNPAHKIIVGWDHPLMTFFGQVIDRKKEEAEDDNHILLWVGCLYRELYEVEALAQKLSGYAKIEPSMRATLYGDKDEGK